MSYELETLLWDNSGRSDKIWGWVKAGENLFCFWGRRQVVDAEGLVGGKRPSLQFKMHQCRYDLQDLKIKKLKKNYRQQDIDDVDDVVPGFTAFFNNALVTARLMGKVRADDWAEC